MVASSRRRIRKETAMAQTRPFPSQPAPPAGNRRGRRRARDAAPVLGARARRPGAPAHPLDDRPALPRPALRLLRRQADRHRRPRPHRLDHRGDPRRGDQHPPRRQRRLPAGQPDGRLHRLRARHAAGRRPPGDRRHEHPRLRGRHARQPRVQLRRRVPRPRQRRRRLPDRLRQLRPHASAPAPATTRSISSPT